MCDARRDLSVESGVRARSLTRAIIGRLQQDFIQPPFLLVPPRSDRAIIRRKDELQIRNADWRLLFMLFFFLSLFHDCGAAAATAAAGASEE